MWPFKNTSQMRRQDTEMPSQRMRCGTPLIQMNENNPDFFIRSAYGQPDGSTIIEDEYPYDGRKEIRVIPKGGSLP